MSSKPRSKNTLAARATSLAAGARKHFPNGAQSLTLDGEAVTVDDVAGDLATLAANRQAVVTAQAAAATKVRLERAQAPALMAVMAAFEVLVRVAFGKSADVLADFGLAPHATAAPMTSEQKAAAVAKRAATRAVRHTMGPV